MGILHQLHRSELVRVHQELSRIYRVEAVLSNGREHKRSQRRKVGSKLGRSASRYAANGSNQVSAVYGRQLGRIKATHKLADEFVELIIRKVQNDSRNGRQSSFSDHGTGRVVINNGHDGLLQCSQFRLF